MQPARLELSAEVRAQLEELVRRPTTPQRLVQRALLVLMVAGSPEVPGKPIKQTARELGFQPKTVRKWVNRVRGMGVLGVADVRRSGRPRRITVGERVAVIEAAGGSSADHGLAGSTRWSASLLAKVLVAAQRVHAISGRSVGRVLKTATIKPHRIEC